MRKYLPMGCSGAWSAVLFSALMFNLTLAAQEKREVSFIIQVRADSLIAGDSLFVSGNHQHLGEWRPGAIALQAQPDGSWSRLFAFPTATGLEFKITRGSWISEALDSEGFIPENHQVVVTRDTVIQLHITGWKDRQHNARKRHIRGQITGELRYHRRLSGKGILPRDVLVWLPPGYRETAMRYPVLYMHDAQNIIDPTTSTHGIDWGVDEMADSLIRAVRMRPIIIVGISNTDDRRAEYSDGAAGQAYLNFLVNDLKPLIDREYRTLPGREHTALMGSSMGGLISFLGVWYYPQVFSMAACLSPAFVYNDWHSIELVRSATELPKDVRIYMDNGGLGLEDTLQYGCDAMLELLRARGWRDEENLLWRRDSEAGHNEAAWAQRVWRPLLFFFATAAENYFD